MEAALGAPRPAVSLGAPRRAVLTKDLLSQLTYVINKDDRILVWLADCEEQISNLPTYLPDINYTFKLYSHMSK